jgi:serine/threonine protein kinase
MDSSGLQSFAEHNRIGEGGFGKVFRGVLHITTDVVVKRPLPGVLNELQADKQFCTEVQALSHARHPNIVTLLGCCPEERLLVYEFVEGGSLQERMGWGGERARAQRAAAAAEDAVSGADGVSPTAQAGEPHRQQQQQPPMSWPQRLQVVVQVASALEYLHRQGILHMCVGVRTAGMRN